MEKITYKNFKELIKKNNSKRLLIKAKGIIKQTIHIKNSKIFLSKNRLIIQDNTMEKINIGIDWVANFYSNYHNTIIKLEFDQIGEVVLYIQ